MAQPNQSPTLGDPAANQPPPVSNRTVLWLILSFLCVALIAIFGLGFIGPLPGEPKSPGPSPEESSSPSSKEPVSKEPLFTGTWSAPLQGSQNPIEVTFDQDGTLSGYDGCNWISGKWIQSSAELKLSEIFSTRRACLNQDEPWFSRSATAQLSQEQSGALDFYDSSGSYLGTLWTWVLSGSSPPGKPGTAHRWRRQPLPRS